MDGCQTYHTTDDPGCASNYAIYFGQNIFPSLSTFSSMASSCSEQLCPVYCSDVPPCAPDTASNITSQQSVYLRSKYSFNSSEIMPPEPFTFTGYTNTINIKPETFSFSFKEPARMFSEILISADVMTLSLIDDNGETTRIAEIYREHSEDASMIDDFYQYLYFHMGIREKYNTDTFKTALTNVEISSSNNNIGEAIKPSSVTSWLKTDGSYADHDLIYGKNIVLAQSENDKEQLIINDQYPHIAQKIKIENNSSLRKNAPTNVATIGCVKIKVNDLSSDIKEWRCIITGSKEVAGELLPDITIDSGGTNRPKNDFQIYSTKALGVAFGKKMPGSDLVEFVFDSPIEINKYDSQNATTTTYWVIITHPALSNVLLGTVAANNYPITIDYDTEASKYLTDLYIKTGDNNKYLNDSNIMAYNITDGFIEIEKNIWIKIYSGSYINLKNKIDGQKIAIKMAARNHAGLISDRSIAADFSTVDLIQPVATLEAMNPISISRRCDLKLTASDNASGIWRFRIVYKDDFNIVKYDQWQYWTAPQGTNNIQFSWYFPGKFYGKKELFAQVQDYAGNIKNTTAIEINMKHGFIIDTEPPHSTSVNINAGADYLNSDMVNIEISAIDDTTGIKDVRSLIGEDDEGNPVYDQWRPYQENMVLDMSNEPDGYKSISYQFRDYANNADQAQTAHALIKTLCPDKLPTAIKTYGYSGEDALYIASTKTTRETGLIGIYKYIDTSERKTFEFQYNTGSKKFFTNSEIITIYINGTELPRETSGTINWTLDLLNQIIRFSTAYPEGTVITADVYSEVAYLDVYDGESLENVYVFDSEKERLMTAMIVYGGKLYLGFASGRIYSYDGAVITYEYLLTSSTGDPLPVGTFGIHKFPTETREFMFTGSLKEARLWSYGGNPALPNYNWKLVDDINNYTGYISAQGGIIHDNLFDNSENWVTTTPIKFNNQNSVITLDSYRDYLFIGTGDTSSIPGDGSAVFMYGKYYDNDGYTINTDIKVNLLKTISKNNGGTQVRALKKFGNKIYAGTNKNSIFAYECIKKLNPHYDIWSNKTVINESFLIKYAPWRYYESGGTIAGFTDPSFSNYLSITSYFDNVIGSIDYYTLNIACDLGVIARFDQTSNETPWSAINNSTGWTVEAELKHIDGDGYQGIEVFDGSYQAEIRFYADKIKVISKDAIDIINISDIELDEYYVKTKLNSIDWIAPEDSNVVANIIDDSLSLSIESNENEEAYIEFESIFKTGKNSQVNMEIAARNFVFSTINIKLYWLEDGETEYTETHSHSFNVYNSNMMKDIIIRPNWSSKTINKMKLVVPSIYGASLNIDKFEVTGEENRGIDFKEINKFRLTGKESTLAVYVNDNNTPIFRKINWMKASGEGKSLSFGKNNYQSAYSKFAWKSIKFASGAYKPKINEHINWTLSGVFPATSKIKKFEALGASLYAYADPLDTIINIVPEEKLHPVVWKLPTYDSLYWGDPEGIEDSFFGENIISVIDTTVWRNQIYSVAEYIKNTTNIRENLKNKFDILDNAITGEQIASNVCGNLYMRKRLHSGYGEIIKDTVGPSASILINADEASNGIKVYKFITFMEE